MPNARVSVAGGAVPAVTAFYTVTPKTRRRIEKAVDTLLALLDEIDGDADFERTSLERAGRAFEVAGEDDDETSHDEEAVNEDGDFCDQGEAVTYVENRFDAPWSGYLEART